MLLCYCVKRASSTKPLVRVYICFCIFICICISKEQAVTSPLLEFIHLGRLIVSGGLICLTSHGLYLYVYVYLFLCFLYLCICVVCISCGPEQSIWTTWPGSWPHFGLIVLWWSLARPPLQFHIMYKCNLHNYTNTSNANTHTQIQGTKIHNQTNSTTLYPRDWNVQMCKEVLCQMWILLRHISNYILRIRIILCGLRFLLKNRG